MEIDSPNNINDIVITRFPFPIAFNYNRMLYEKDTEKKLRMCLQVFEYTIRTLALGLLSQYLTYDIESIDNAVLNKLLRTKISKATLGSWVEIFFSTIEAYRDHKDKLFIPEFFDFYWTLRSEKLTPRENIRKPYSRLVEIRNDLYHGVDPKSEDGWRNKLEEVYPIIQNIFSHLSFLENYNLLYLEKNEGGKLYFEKFSGLGVESVSTPIITKKLIKPKLFYLSNKNFEYLSIYPFFLLDDSHHLKDSILYDRFRSKSLDYLATTLGYRLNLTNEDLIEDFILTINKLQKDEIEGNKKIKFESATWKDFKIISSRISERGVATISAKYIEELYVQRTRVKKSTELFLSSHKPCVSIVGPSGSGKSNFLLSIYNEYKENIAYSPILFNGALLNAEESFQEMLQFEFSKYLYLEGNDKEWLSKTIQKVKKGKKVLLIIDGINENHNAVQLLRNIDEFVVKYNAAIKIIISSRPETWRILKRQANLSKEDYYWEEDEGSLSLHLNKFSPFELSMAYKKYQSVYNIKTNFETLSHQIAELISDPFVLNLLSEIYHDRDLPKYIDAKDLYKNYVESLIKTNLLDIRDVRFLEKDLIPLMISREIIVNTLSNETIDYAKTSDGRDMFELIHNDDAMSDGRKVNQSFVNLCDAKILSISYESPLVYKLKIQFDRFYEYLAGIYLYEIYKNESAKEKILIYKNILDNIGQYIYVWGCLKYALRIEFEKLKNHTLLEGLCENNSQLGKDFMIDLLADIGVENSNNQPIEAFLLKLIESDSIDKSYVAIHVARKLRVINVLYKAAIVTNSVFKSDLASHQTYHLWREDQNAGYTILTLVAAEIKRAKLRRKARPLLFCIVVSFLILFNNTHNKDALKLLQNLWRKIMQENGVVEKKKTKLGVYIRKLLLSSLFDLVGFALNKSVKDKDVFIANSDFSRLSNVKWVTPLSLPEISAFFTSGKERKETASRILAFGCDNNSNLPDATNDLSKALSYLDTLSILIASLTILVHAKKNGSETLAVLRKCFEIALAQNPVGPGITFIRFDLIALYRLLPEKKEENAKLLMDMVKETYTHTKGFFVSETGKYYNRVDIGRATIIYKKVFNEIPEFFFEFLEDAFGTHQTNYQSIQNEIGLLADFSLVKDWYGDIELSHYLELYKLMLEKAKTLLPESGYQQIRGYVVSALAWMRIYYTNDIDDFVAENSFTNQEIVEINTKISESSGDILGRSAAIFFFDLIGNNTFPEFRDRILKVLKNATAAKSSSRWYSLIVINIINIIYGQEYFEL
jgi:hypothetical protein